MHEMHTQSACNTIELWFSIVWNDIRTISNEMCVENCVKCKRMSKSNARKSTTKGREGECSIKLKNYRHSATRAAAKMSIDRVCRTAFTIELWRRGSAFLSVCAYFCAPLPYVIIHVYGFDVFQTYYRNFWGWKTVISTHTYTVQHSHSSGCGDDHTFLSFNWNVCLFHNIVTATTAVSLGWHQKQFIKEIEWMNTGYAEW